MTVGGGGPNATLPAACMYIQPTATGMNIGVVSGIENATTFAACSDTMPGMRPLTSLTGWTAGTGAVPNCTVPGALPPAIRGSGDSASSAASTSYRISDSDYTISIFDGAMALRLCGRSAANSSATTGAVDVTFGAPAPAVPYTCIAFEPLTNGLGWKAGASGGACPTNMTE